MIKIFIALSLCFSFINEISAKQLHFALLSAGDAQEDFWRPVEDFALQAAEQLDVKLTILHTSNSKRKLFTMLEKAKELNVDAAIFPSDGQAGLKLLELAEQLKLPVLLFNSDLSEANKLLAGKPQQKLKYWLASMMPDNEQAGYLLGKHLIGQARQNNLTSENGLVEIIAINGTIANAPSQSRLAGLQRAIKEDANSILLQSVYGYWSREKVYYKTPRLAKRHPNAKVYWAASDLMAIGADEGLSDLGLVLGKDYLNGGVDWSERGFSAIKNGQLSASAGGHFMDGAWSVIMLYDHFNGSPFTTDTVNQLQSPMSLISNEKIDFLMHGLASGDWSSIDFRARSKTLNKQLKEYNFSPVSVIDELSLLKVR
tara:strand:+ start:1560 stop:2672 length:1113 start_codon:yes stop_codon:yes gene_type:complete